MRCSSRPWNQCSSINTERRITTWRSPGLQCTNTLGKNFKTQCAGVFWGLLTESDSSSIKHDPTRSSFTTLHLRFASRWWWSGSQETKWERIVLKPNLHYGRQDTKSFDARTSTDHSSKHMETCSGEKYMETCRGEIDFRIQGLPHSTVQQPDHTRKAAVQKLIRQFEAHPNRETLKADLKQNHAFNPLSEQSKETAWETWSTSRCAKSLPRYNDTTVLHTEQKKFYTVLTEHACDLQRKLEN